MTFIRIFLLIKKAHPEASLPSMYYWSCHAYSLLNHSSFESEERKILCDYLHFRCVRRYLSPRRDQLNWFLYGINHGVYVVDGVTRCTHC